MVQYSPETLPNLMPYDVWGWGLVMGKHTNVPVDVLPFHRHVSLYAPTLFDAFSHTYFAW